MLLTCSRVTALPLLLLVLTTFHGTAAAQAPLPFALPMKGASRCIVVAKVNLDESASAAYPESVRIAIQNSLAVDLTATASKAGLTVLEEEVQWQRAYPSNTTILELVVTISASADQVSAFVAGISLTACRYLSTELDSKRPTLVFSYAYSCGVGGSLTGFGPTLGAGIGNILQKFERDLPTLR